MTTLRTFTSSLILIAICGLMSTEALAWRHHHYSSSSYDNTSTLSWRSIRHLAKRYLDDFQAVDPSISYRDLLHYIDSLNASSTTEAEAALQDYLASLQDSSSPVNQAPTISGQPAASVDEGQFYAFMPSASDAEGDSLTFSVVNCPNWASFDSQSGTLRGTPDYNAAGTYDSIQISVNDGELSAALPAFSITVNEVSQDPVDSTPDPVTGAPTLLSASVNGDSVSLAWTPQDNDIPDGGYDIVLDGRDTNTQYRTTATSTSISGLDLSQSHCFAVQARYTSSNEFYDSNELCTDAQASPNEPPVISGTPQTTVQVGEHYSFTPASSDADGDTLSFTANNLPAWANLDSQTGTLSGTPGTQDAGSYTGIEIQVSDGEMTASLPSFSITVDEVTQDPVTGAPTLLSASVNGDSVSLAWTPQDNDIPDGGYDIVLDGRDTNTQYRTTATSTSISGLDLTQSHCFAVQARYTSANEFYDSNELCTDAQASPNEPPVISGTPQTSVQVGERYSFTPASSDVDGDTLSFTAVNLPAWASFDSQTGALSGTPEAQDEGSYPDIEILVSDGEASASLSPFTLTVEASQSTAVSTTLSWTAPSTRSDGTPLSLSDINGYRIYVGESETSLAPVVDINDYSVTEYTLTDLSVDSHYFGITAYDVDGNESGLSNIILLPSL